MNSINSKNIIFLFTKMQCFVKKINDNASTPIRATSGSAGYDVTIVEYVELSPGQRRLVSTGLTVAVPEGYYMRVAPRSGLAVKGIDVGAGVVDSDYRGEVKVLLVNNSNLNQCLSIGMKVAQFIFEKIGYPEMILVDNLPITQRGEGGFGSTGI